MASEFVPVRYETFQLEGGLDLVTPTLSLKAGAAREAMNWEISISGGFGRIHGYERFDGRAGNPSDAQYSVFSVASTVGLAVGDAINNAGAPTLGTATATIIAISAGSVYYTQVVNSFAVGHFVRVGAGANIGPITAVGLTAITAVLNATYTALAANVYRALIGTVGGASCSGPVLGLAQLGGVYYAWRNNIGGTALTMWKATTAGWASVALGFELSFAASGTTPIVDGAAITQGAVTGTVARVVLETGTWAAGTAAGRLILSATSAPWVAAGNILVAAVIRATVTAPAGSATYLGAAITLLPSGRVQAVSSNFGGIQSNKLYGCDNNNRGFEFDGTTYVPIRTGMATDKPDNVSVHKNYLLFTFGPSIQFSALGLPYQWSAVLGAGEFVVSDVVTGLVVLPGNQGTGALGVYTKGNTYILYGSAASGANAFNLIQFNTGFGAAKYSIQAMESCYVLDDRGVVGMSASLNYGNFDTSTLTLNIRQIIQANRGRLTASALNREKSQYRIFYSDGTGIFMTINNGKYAGAMPVLFPNPVTCWCESSAIATIGAEISYFGSTDGYVRRMDVGTSFDGAVIDSLLTLNFNSIRSSRVLKRWRKASLEISSDALYVQTNIGYNLAYAETAYKDQPGASAVSYSRDSKAAYWDSFTWDRFNWDFTAVGPLEIEMIGTGENMSMTFNGSSAIVGAFTINTITLHYSMRRGLR